MPRLSETITRLKSLQGAGLAPAADRLSDLSDVGPNPGGLRARTYVPDAIAPDAALVVVLHGCTQTAASYDQGAGWSELADRHGFALLFPEQSIANNPARCFNWFERDDTRRGAGEAMSIHQMILAMRATHDLDPRRVYITGLSAGGAMAMAMLAAYPEVFAGGAVIAGLPYGCAGSVREALERMRGQGLPAPRELAARVRGASAHRRPWPTLSVWHGSADHTVSAANADAIVAQWGALHGTAAEADVVETFDRHSRRVWRDGEGRVVIEARTIAGMGHGTPIDATTRIGAAGPFMLDVGISSTEIIAQSWGLAPAGAAARPETVTDAATRAPRRVEAAPGLAARAAGTSTTATSDVGRIIEDALRAAGLMR